MPVSLDTVATFGADLDLDEGAPLPLHGLETDDRSFRPTANKRLAGTATERGERRGVTDRLEHARLAGPVFARDDGQSVGIRLEEQLGQVAEVSEFEPGDAAQETRTGISRYR